MDLPYGDKNTCLSIWINMDSETIYRIGFRKVIKENGCFYICALEGIRRPRKEEPLIFHMRFRKFSFIRCITGNMQ